MKRLDMNEIVIQTNRLSKKFPGDVEAVRELSLAVPRGVVYGLIGRNGAGKTTLIRMLMGLLRPSAGQGTLLGQEMLRAGPAHRCRVAYVSQEFRLPQWMTLAELCHGTSLYYPTWDADLATALTRRFELDPLRPVGRFSGGQRCKVGILLALASRAEVLMLDEPAASLDPIARRHLVEEIIDLIGRGDGHTVLFSTHIISDLERVADRIGIMENGRMVTDTALEDLQSNIRRVQVVFPGDAPPADFTIEGALKVQVSGPVVSAIMRVSDDREIDKFRAIPGVRVNAFPVGLEDLFINLLGESQAAEMMEVSV
jgi:ABC-2 type transport system ATP-binding protein